MALSTARIHRVRGRPPLLAAGITSLIHSHSSSVRSLGYVFSFIYPCYTTHEDFSDRLLEAIRKPINNIMPISSSIFAVMKGRPIAGSESIKHKMHMTDLDHRRVWFQKWKWPCLHRPPKGIAVDKQANDDIVHLCRF